MAKLINEAEFAFLAEIDSCTLSNAIEQHQVRDRDQGYLGGEIRCLFPELPRTVGYAVTAKVRNRRGEPGDPEGNWRLWEHLESAPSPAVLVFESTDDVPDRCAHFGEVMCTFAVRLGAIGLVTNGGVRDLAEVLDAGFQYFAPFQTVSHGNAEIYDVGSTVRISGENIESGELLHGDKHGVLKIPQIDIEDLRNSVSNVFAAERELINFVKSDAFTLSGARNLGGYSDG